jgi:tRNA nucleotidyltransferase (CCA-adding enzyme)
VSAADVVRDTWEEWVRAGRLHVPPDDITGDDDLAFWDEVEGRLAADAQEASWREFLHPRSRLGKFVGKPGKPRPAIAEPEVAESMQGLDRLEAALAAADPESRPAIEGFLMPTLAAALDTSGFELAAADEVGPEQYSTTWVHGRTGSTLSIESRDQIVTDVGWEPGRPQAAHRAERPIRSWAELRDDGLALGEELADRYDAPLKLRGFAVDRELGDTSGLHDWDGDASIGPDAQTVSELAGQLRADGQELPDDTLGALWFAEQVTAHEISHSVNNISYEDYVESNIGRALEEALTEESASSIAADRARARGETDVLEWLRANQARPYGQGTYHAEREGLQFVLDKAGVAPEDRARVIADLKFRVPPSERLDYLGEMLLDNGKSEQAAVNVLRRLDVEMTRAPRRLGPFNVVPDLEGIEPQSRAIGFGRRIYFPGQELVVNARERGLAQMKARVIDGDASSLILQTPFGLLRFKREDERDIIEVHELGTMELPDGGEARVGDEVEYVRPDDAPTRGRLVWVHRRSRDDFLAEVRVGNQTVVITPSATKGVRRVLSEAEFSAGLHPRDRLGRWIRSLGFKAYRVGGAVRDPLIGKQPKDVDFMVMAAPEAIKQAVEAHGGRVEDLIVRDRLVGVRAYVPDVTPPGGVEIAPPRIEKAVPAEPVKTFSRTATYSVPSFGIEQATYVGHTRRSSREGPGKVKLRKANGEVGSFFPDEVQVARSRHDFVIEPHPGVYGSDVNDPATRTAMLEADANRRDFTANALYQDEDTGDVIDPTGTGLLDLRAGLLRTTSPESFQEDPLRILRGTRFMSQHDFELHPETEAQMREHAPQIDALTQKGVSGTAQTELTKTLMGSNVGTALRKMRDTGVLAQFLPELAPTIGFDQQSQYHDLPLDEHIISVVENLAANNAPLELRLAALFHDAGKPETAWRGDDGNLHFYPNPELGKEDHAVAGARIARAALERLNYPRETISRVARIIQHHMVNVDMTNAATIRRWRQTVGADLVGELIQHRRADFGAKGEGPDEGAVANLDRFAELATREQQAPTKIRELAIDGHDLIALGMEPGPEMGRILRELLDIVLEDPALNEREVLLGLARAKLAGVIREAVGRGGAALRKFDDLKHPRGHGGEFRNTPDVVPEHPYGGGPAAAYARVVSPEEFDKPFREALQGDGGAWLSDYKPEERAGHVLLLSPDGKAGAAVKPDGDIVSVFRLPGGEKGSGRKMLREAIAHGGSKLDAIGDGLRGLYEAEGFSVNESVDWDDQYAPPGWNYERDGRPKVYFMLHGSGPQREAAALSEASRASRRTDAGAGAERGGDLAGVPGADLSRLGRAAEARRAGRADPDELSEAKGRGGAALRKFEELKHPRGEAGKFRQTIGSQGHALPQARPLAPGEKLPVSAPSEFKFGQPRKPKPPAHPLYRGKPSPPQAPLFETPKAPPTLDWVEPPAPKGSGSGKAGGFSASGQTNTEIGDLGEKVVEALDLRSLLPPGRRQNPLDAEYDHSGMGFEIKTVTTDAKEYKVGMKTHEMASKRDYAERHDLVGGVMIVVLDVDGKQAWAYWREGIRNGRLRQEDWHHMGHVQL